MRPLRRAKAEPQPITVGCFLCNREHRVESAETAAEWLRMHDETCQALLHDGWIHTGLR